MKKENKTLCGFSYVKSMANFDAFCWIFSSSTNPQIMRSALLGIGMDQIKKAETIYSIIPFVYLSHIFKRTLQHIQFNHWFNLIFLKLT